MAIPSFKDLFTDILIVLSDRKVTHRNELISDVLNRVELTDAERAETMSRGGNRARSRVDWSLEYLCQAGATSRPKRGFVEITDFGFELLQEHPGGVKLDHLRQTEGIKEWSRRSKANAAARRSSESVVDNETADFGGDQRTPHEQIELAVRTVESVIASELLHRLRNEAPVFLEQTVLRLLHAMGYGSSEDDLEHLGGPGDGGVDGVIHQDKLGLDQVYVQAKRYSNGTVGRPDIQSFVGALTGKQATRGVFITTSEFSRDALEYARTIQQFRIILIDGEKLAELMIQHKVGVAVSRTFDLVEIDENFFTEE